MYGRAIGQSIVRNAFPFIGDMCVVSRDCVISQVCLSTALFGEKKERDERFTRNDVTIPVPFHGSR